MFVLSPALRMRFSMFSFPFLTYAEFEAESEAQGASAAAAVPTAAAAALPCARTALQTRASPDPASHLRAQRR